MSFSFNFPDPAASNSSAAKEAPPRSTTSSTTESCLLAKNSTDHSAKPNLNVAQSFFQEHFIASADGDLDRHNSGDREVAGDEEPSTGMWIFFLFSVIIPGCLCTFSIGISTIKRFFDSSETVWNAVTAGDTILQFICPQWLESWMEKRKDTSATLASVFGVTEHSDIIPQLYEGEKDVSVRHESQNCDFFRFVDLWIDWLIDWLIVTWINWLSSLVFIHPLLFHCVSDCWL